jgi:molybdopterin-guanine dinucleotide biosynthesis protein B
MKPIVSIVGKTNSGKTTLIEKLIPELKKRGYKVGVIKHTKHQFEIDHPGKDTWRMTKAGADTVVIASDKKLAMIRATNNEPRTTDLDELAEWLFPDVDIVITEGYKKQNKPKIEVTRSGELLCNTRYDNLLAVVFNPSRTTNYQTLISGLNVPCFGFDEISSIADFIVNKYGSRNL